MSSQILKCSDDRHIVAVVTETFSDRTNRLIKKPHSALLSGFLPSSGGTGKEDTTAVRLLEGASPIRGLTGPPD